MTLETDLLIDRRRLKRRLNVWRVVAVIAVAGALIAAFRGEIFGPGRHIERLNVTGIIGDDRKLTEAVDKLARTDSVAALIVSIDSPGGSASGGQGLHDAIARVAARKPVVAVMRGVAASAGYMVALPAQRIFARDGTLTGSIGVLLEAPEVSGLMGKLGVSVNTIVSGPLKDQPSFFHPTSPEGQKVLQELVMDLYGQFVDMVATGRHMDPARVRQLADGRAFTGRQAVQLGLVDQIGGEPEARAWLAREKKVPMSLPVRDLSVSDWAGRALGAAFGGFMKSVWQQGLTLDAVWAIWQPGFSGT